MPVAATSRSLRIPMHINEINGTTGFCENLIIPMRRHICIRSYSGRSLADEDGISIGKIGGGGEHHTSLNAGVHRFHFLVVGVDQASIEKWAKVVYIRKGIKMLGI